MIRKTFGNTNYGILLLAIIFFGLAIFQHDRFNKPSFKISKQDSKVNINKDLLRMMSLGNKRMIADLIWIQTLLESDLERYTKSDLGSWMYLRFVSISELDPLFYENYLFGGQYLSIVKDDVEGAASLYERGLVHYPNDFRLNLNAGFNYYFEMGDYKNGLKCLEKIEYHPKASVAIPSIVHKLKAETGTDLETVLGLVTAQYKSSQDQELKERLLKDMYAIKAEIDLKCLNTKKQNCDTKDLHNNAYVLKGNSYAAQIPYLPYKLNRKAQRNQ